jgi:hypothetical protein
MRKQQGFVLVVALLLLIALSLIGVAAMRNVSLQEKMAGNFYFRTTINHETESTLRRAKNNTLAAIFNGTATGQDLGPEYSISFWSRTANWVNATTNPQTAQVNPNITIDVGNSRSNVEQVEGKEWRGSANLPVSYFRSSALTTETGTGATAVVQEWLQLYTR